MKSPHYLRALFALTALSAATSVYAQTISYTQNFGSLSWNSAETPSTWTDSSTAANAGSPDGTLAGWSISSSTTDGSYRPGWSGSQASGNLVNAAAGDFIKVLQVLNSGTSGSGNRVWDGDNRLGARTGATPGNSFATLQLTNTTGAAIDSFSVGYEAAQFLARESGAIDVRYSFNNSTWTTISGGGTTTGSTNMRYTAPVTSTGVNLNLSATQIADSIQSIASTVSGISWADGTSIFVQFAFWRDIPGGSTGNAPVLSIDDVSFSATSAIPEPSSFAALAGLGALALVALRRRRRA